MRGMLCPDGKRPSSGDSVPYNRRKVSMNIKLTTLRVSIRVRFKRGVAGECSVPRADVVTAHVDF